VFLVSLAAKEVESRRKDSSSESSLLVYDWHEGDLVISRLFLRAKEVAVPAVNGVCLLEKQSSSCFPLMYFFTFTLIFELEAGSDILFFDLKLVY
jgi:hypothetical protein